MTELIIQNEHLRLGFSSDGRLISFFSLKTDDEYLKGLGDPVSLFTLMVEDQNQSRPDASEADPHRGIVEWVSRYIRPSDQIEAIPTPGTVFIEGETAIIRTESVRTASETLPISAEIRVRLIPNSAESHWTIHLQNEASRTIFAVTLPRMHGVRLGDSWMDDALYCPFRGGERFASAIQDFADMAEGCIPEVEMGQPRVVKQDNKYVYELPYAGRASMMWMDYADGAQGLYMASHDPEFLVTILHADTEGPSGGVMNLELRRWVTIRPGETWTSAPFVAAAHDGDWHWASGRYRSWFSEHVSLSFHGGSMRETVGIYLPFMKAADGRVKYRFSELPELYDKAERAGIDHLMPYGWMTGGFDTFYPEFQPDLELGGPMEMARAHKEIRSRGGHLVNYINSRIFNRRSIYFEKLGRKWAAKKVDGTDWTETYGPESFAVMCPGAIGWRNLLADLAEALVQMYDSDVIYYDQLSAMAVACHDETHGHKQIGLRNQQYVELLKEATDLCRQVNKDVAFSIETASDIYAPYALFQGTIGVWLAGTRFNFPELYKYTFPEVIGLSFVFYTKNLPDALMSPFPELSRELAARWLCREILLGNAFGVLDQNFVDHPWWDEAQQLLALRKAATPWMGHGVFRDTVDVVSASDGLEVKTFRLDRDKTQSVLVGVYNEGQSSNGQVAVRCGPLSKLEAFRLGLDGVRSPVPVELQNENVTLEASSDLLSLTVIEGRLR